MVRKTENPSVGVPVSGSQVVHITAPNMRVAEFEIEGTAPLVIHRFSVKSKQEMLVRMQAGSAGAKRKIREKLDEQAVYTAARYVSKEGWDGFNAAAVRGAMVKACSITTPPFKMTLAKMCIFAIADGRDAQEPEFSLIKINGAHRMLQSVARVETGQPYITIRPCYDEWSAKLHIRFDADQFSFQDIANLLARVGEQVGFCEGRPASTDSCGMGWGTFRVKGVDAAVERAVA
jgi:hypothetical protein